MKTAPNVKKVERELPVSIYVLIYEFAGGILEVLTGVALALYGSRMYELYQASLIRELSEDPDDLLAHISERLVPNVLTHNTYVIVYLLALGLVKIVGAIGLVKKQNWGVDLLVGLITLMVPFQVAGLIVHRNWFDLIFLAVGLVVALYLVKFRPAAWISRIMKLK